MARRRADVLLAEKGFFESRERAKAAILAGHVRCGDVLLTKAGELVDEASEFRVAETPRFVSRGGVKLAGALEAFGIDPKGMRVLDVGASTGGFTDCVLQAGAAGVVALDVGYGQLAWQLRQDQRVEVLERTNIRTVERGALGEQFDLVMVDVSFVGLLKVLPNLLDVLSATGTLLALVKPQFEAGKGRVGKKGVVRDPAVHADVVSSVLDGLRQAGLLVRGVTWSPVKGPEGNIEFWVRADRVGPDEDLDIDVLIADAHRALGD